MFDWNAAVPLLLGGGVMTAAVELIRLFVGRKKGRIDAAASLTTSALGLSDAYSGQVDFLEKRLAAAHEEIEALGVKLRSARTTIEEQEARLSAMAREITGLREAQQNG